MSDRLKLQGPAGPIHSDQGALFGSREVVGFQRGDLIVEPMDRDTANELIVANHYSGKFYNASYIHLAVVWGEELVGVLQYGYAMNPTSQGGVVAGTEPDQYLELNRMWIDDRMPRNSESAAIALSLKFIRAAHPGVRWIQSFADERCRLFGGVYQACSFLYCGEHTAVFWEIDGQWFHNSIMTRDPDLTPSAKWAQDNRERATPHNLRQFRYVKFLRPKYRRDLLLPVLPYPKPHAAGLGEKRPASSREVQVRCLPAALDDEEMAA